MLLRREIKSAQMPAVYHRDFIYFISAPLSPYDTKWKKNVSAKFAYGKKKVYPELTHNSQK